MKTSGGIEGSVRTKIIQKEFRNNPERQPRQFHDVQIKIEKLNSVKPKGLRGFIQFTRLGNKNQPTKEKQISTLKISQNIQTFRKRSSKPEKPEKLYQSLHLKNMVNLDLCERKDKSFVVEIYSKLGEVWQIYATEEMAKQIFDEIRDFYKILRDSNEFKKELEYFNLGFVGDVEYVHDRNSVKKEVQLTTGRKIILLKSTPNDRYQLELRDYDCVGGNKIIINQDHAYSWSITGKEIHFCLNDKGPMGRIDFLIICFDDKKISERIKPFIAKEPNSKTPKLTEEQIHLKKRNEKALNARRLNDKNRRPMARSRSNYCNSIEQRSWKSSKSPNPSNSPNDSGVTAGTPESNEYK